MTTAISAQTPGTSAYKLNDGKSTQETSATKEADTAKNQQSAATGHDDSVKLSSRASKIQKIAEEFFSGGGLSMEDIPKYIQRLQSDGFLTGQEVENLGYTKSAEQEALSEQTTKLLDFIGEFKNKVAAKDPEDSLINTLDKAKKVIENLDKSKDSSLAADVKTSLVELDTYLKSDKAEQWNEQEIKSLTDVKNILSVTNQLHFSQTDSKAANRYLLFSGRGY